MVGDICSSLADESKRFEAAFFESVRVFVLRFTNTGVGKNISLPEINARINEVLKQMLFAFTCPFFCYVIHGKLKYFQPKFICRKCIFVFLYAHFYIGIVKICYTKRGIVKNIITEFSSITEISFLFYVPNFLI